MKEIICLLIVSCLLVPAMLMAESFESSSFYKAYTELPEQQRTDEKKNEYQEMFVVEQKVKNISFRYGDTMDTYLTKRGSIPIAEDQGWQVRKKDDGYEVERTLFMEGKDYLHYTWFVSRYGETTPMNKRTKKLYEMAEKANKRPNNKV